MRPSFLLVPLWICAGLPAQADDPDALASHLRSEPGDVAGWQRLAGVVEAGAALRATRALLAEHPQCAHGWSALWRLADRVADFPAGAEAAARAAALGGEQGILAELERAEAALAQHLDAEGELHGEIQAIRRCIAYRKAAAGDARALEEWRERIEIQSRLREHPDPAKLRAAISEARAGAAWRDEHRLLCDLAYHLWVTGSWREGHAHYARILEIDAAHPEREEQNARDLNGAARLAVELAVSCAGGERERLLDEARSLATRALRLHLERALGGPLDLVRNHCVLAHAAEAAGDDASAAEHHRQEYELVRAMRRTAAVDGDAALRVFHGAQDHVYADYALHLARGGPARTPDCARALAVSEEGRTGALEALFRLRGLPLPRMGDGLADVEALRRRLDAAKTALVVYLCGSRDAGAIVLDSGGLRFAPLGPLAGLDAAAAALARAAFDLSSRDAPIESAARAAFDRFIAPLGLSLPARNRLVIVGAGRFGHLPFAALASPGPEPLERRWLASRVELAHAPTVGSLGAPAPRAPPSKPVSFGFDGRAEFDPRLRDHFRLDALPPLARAGPEARTVAAKLGGAALCGRDATEAALRNAAPGAGILHLAGHAIVDDEDSSRTALLLAPGAGSDGLLTLGEMLELRLGARLVILSGCRTARGETWSGEGTGAIARCLLASGARALVLSIAAVDDAKAPVLIGHLADALAAGEPPPRALALAQRRMMRQKSCAHPALWSEFVLHGTGGLLDP